MAEGYDWAMRPWSRGLLPYRELLDGSVSLVDIARMNEALDVQQENEHRYREWLKDHPNG
jgi:hypothetical protein